MGESVPTFERFYAATARRLYTALCLTTGDRHEAEKIAQFDDPTGFEDDVADLEARVDGQDVADLDAYRTTSPMFTVTLPEDNLVAIEPGVGQMVSDTISFIVAPPPPGEYEIAVSVRLTGDPEPVGVTTTVIVEPPRVGDPPPTT